MNPEASPAPDSAGEGPAPAAAGDRREQGGPDPARLWRSFHDLDDTTSRKLGPTYWHRRRGVCQIKIAQIQADGRHFIPDPGGFAAHVLAVWDACPIEGGQIIDLVAWREENPSKWWIHVNWGDCLGRWLVGCWAADPDRPTLIYRTPLAWSRAGGQGVCLLTHNPAEQRAIVAQLGVVANGEPGDRAHVRELQALVRPRPGPRVLLHLDAEA